MLNNIKWFMPSEEGDFTSEEKGIVVSSRIRVARNLENIHFEIKMKPADSERLVALTRSIIETKLRGKLLLLQKLTPLERESLLECYLISPAFAKADRPAAVFINEKGNISIMINEEDHLRIQGLSCGLNLPNISSEVFNVEAMLGEDLGYAFSETYGFLTSCPTNLGTGLRTSVLLHLPGLVFTNEVEKVLKSAVNSGMTVRGIYGEGTEIKGNLFQFSNQHTLGLKEEEMIEGMTKFTRMIVDFEKKTRDIVLSKARYEFEDKVFRSLAILKSAVIINSDEVLNLLSAVRVGIEVGIIKDINLDTINEIMFVTRPANLQMHYGELLEGYERDIKRAEYIRKKITLEIHTE